MKCGFCKKQMVGNGDPTPTLKVERARLVGDGRWTEHTFAIVCPFCEAIIGFVSQDQPSA